MPKPASGASLDTGNALYSALTHVWAFLEGSGSSSNDSKGTNHLTLNGSVTWATEAGDPVIAMASALSRPAALTSSVFMSASGDWSIFFSAKQTASNSNGMVAGAFNNTTDFLWMQAAQLTYRNSNSGGRNYSISGGFTVFANYALVHVGATGVVSLYKNGALVGSVGLAVGQGALTIDTIGNAYTGTLYSLIGQVAYFYICSNYAASPSDVAAMNADPYAIFGAAPATSYTLSGPTSGTVNVASTNFTVAPNGSATGTVITPASTGSGTFSPTSVTISGSTSATFTYTPSSTAGSPHTISVTNTGGLTNPASVAYTVNAATGTVTLGTIRRVDQRSGADVSKPVSGTYTGEVNNVQCRVLLNSDSSVVVDWTTVAASVSGGAWSGNISIPHGGPYIIQTRCRDISNNVLGSASDSTTFLVGDLFLVTGQSNAIGRGSNLQTYTGSRTAWMVNESGTITNLANPWSVNNVSTDGSIGPLLANLVDASQSVPTIWMIVGSSGVAISLWASGGSMRTTIASRVAAINPNAIRAVLFVQGETDVLGAITESGYLAAEADLASFCATLPGSPPMIASCLAEVTTQTTAIDKIQKAKIANWNAAATRAGPFPMPINLSVDALHYKTDTELAQFAALWWFAVEAVCYGGTRSRGPRLSSATSDGISNNLILTFDQDLDISDSVYTTSIVTVNNDTGTARTVTSVTRTSIRTVTVVLSGPLNGDAPTVSYGVGRTLSGATVIKTAAISLPATINSLASQPLYAESFFSEPVTVAGDTVPPTVVSVSTTATQLTIVFSEVVQGNAGFSLASSASSIALSSPTGAGTNSRTFTLSRSIVASESLALSYSVAGDISDLSGNLLAPFSAFLVTNGAANIYTAAANVRYNTDRGDGVLGTLRVPTASQVLQGTLVDATTGLLTIPTASNVRNTVVYGSPSVPLTGTLVLPDISNVRLDTGYGAGGTEFTGTLIVSGDGGAADWTPDERAAIRAILGIPSSGTTPTGGTLADIPKSGDTVQHQQVSDNGTDTVVVSIEKV